MIALQIDARKDLPCSFKLRVFSYIFSSKFSSSYTHKIVFHLQLTVVAAEIKKSSRENVPLTTITKNLHAFVLLSTK